MSVTLLMRNKLLYRLHKSIMDYWWIAVWIYNENNKFINCPKYFVSACIDSFIFGCRHIFSCLFFCCWYVFVYSRRLQDWTFLSVKSADLEIIFWKYIPSFKFGGESMLPITLEKYYRTKYFGERVKFRNVS